MKAREIVPNVYLIGHVDWDRRLFDALIPLPDGTSYNAYLVRGNQTRLAPGMCFSDEPTVAIPGEFGVRLEDCMYITGDGARLFTKQSPAIDQPFG